MQPLQSIWHKVQLNAWNARKSHSVLRGPSQQFPPPSHQLQMRLGAILVVIALPLATLPHTYFPPSATAHFQQPTSGYFVAPAAGGAWVAAGAGAAPAFCPAFCPAASLAGAGRLTSACPIQQVRWFCYLCCTTKGWRGHLFLILQAGEDLIWVVPFTREVWRCLLARVIISNECAIQSERVGEARGNGVAEGHWKLHISGKLWASMS